MVKKTTAIALIYVVATLAWILLGTSLSVRSSSTSHRLAREVSGLWGAEQLQVSPELKFRFRERTVVKEKTTDAETGEETLVEREGWKWHSVPVLLDSSDIDVDIALEQRRKGLLWYPTYTVGFDGEFTYEHQDREGFLDVTYRFPSASASYDGFRFEVGGVGSPKSAPALEGGEQVLRSSVPVRRGTSVPLAIAYRTRGVDAWHYSFGSNVNRVKNFRMTMVTGFEKIDFPEGSISPSAKRRAGSGWELDWDFDNLVSGFRIGMEMPRKLNPGPLASRISFFAPVSLGFFFVWMFMITLFRKVDLHPMNYLFLGAAFFAFHLLFSYTVDHVALVPAFVLASGVSVFLVVSYLRLVAGLRFAAVEAGVSQVIYLVLFSYAHFFEGFTGLIVTCGSILTLFALMQLTGRVDWAGKFASRESAPAPGAA